LSSTWLNRFHSLPSGKRKKEQLNVRDLTIFSVFAPYFRCSLSFHKKHICLTGYIGGQNSTSSGVPIHTSPGVLPLAMQALLVTLIKLFLNYKPSAGRGKPGTWVTGQTFKSK
jgi:hypothetical protein